MQQQDFRDQLSSVRQFLPVDIRNDLRNPLPNANESGDDGVDHINIWADGETELGRGLSHGFNLEFTHSHFGDFVCMEAFWHFIRSAERDDRTKILYGQRLNQFSKKTNAINVPNFKALIMDANLQKIDQYPDLKEELTDSELPFECYFYKTLPKGDKIRQRPAFAPWLIWGFNEIRQALKDNREPDFTPLMDKDDVDIYEAAKNAPSENREYKKRDDKNKIKYTRQRVFNT